MSLFIAVMLLSAQAAAVPQSRTPEPVAAAPAAKPVKPKKICKNLDADTGTHMSNRVCKTEDEWAVFNRGKSMEDLGTKGARTQ